MKFLAFVLTAALSPLIAAAQQPAGASWSADPIWHDGLVEKAVYESSRVIYGRDRSYESVIFTNKEQHDLQTLTKSDKSARTVEVWKHNIVEVIPTPNYDYKITTTSHLLVDGMKLTRMESGIQEYCGTSFKQYQLGADQQAWDYWAFSYMPESGRRHATVRAPEGRSVVAEDSLPLHLRGFDFDSGAIQPIALLPSQKSNRHSPHEPIAAEIRPAGEEDGAHRLEVVADGKVLGTYWMATDRRHVMVRYEGADGQTHRLKALDRVDYWTRRE